VIGIILTVLYVAACLVLIMFVLLQPGKSDAAAVFGGGVNSAAFGPRGTQTVLAKVTITAAILFFMIAFLFSIPGLFEKRSLGEGVGPAESAPAPVIPATPTGELPTAPETAQPLSPSVGQPAAAPAKTPDQKDENKNIQSKPAPSKNAAKPGAEKKN
jgi:protein translocase SecG subunit